MILALKDLLEYDKRRERPQQRVGDANINGCLVLAASQNEALWEIRSKEVGEREKLAFKYGEPGRYNRSLA